MLILELAQEAHQMCCDMKPFLKIIDLFIKVLQVSVPIILIVLGSIDVFKMMVNGDGKENSKITKSLIKRLVYAVIIFIVPWLVELSLSFIERFFINPEANGNTFTEMSATSWVECWNHFGEESFCSSYDDIYKPGE